MSAENVFQTRSGMIVRSVRDEHSARLEVSCPTCRAIFARHELVGNPPSDMSLAQSAASAREAYLDHQLNGHAPPSVPID